MTGKEAPNKRNMQKFVRYAEGAKMYSMGLSKFQELAKDAKACYKVGQLVLVNTEILCCFFISYKSFHHIGCLISTRR